MGEHVVGRMLSDVHFVVVERVHGKVVSRVGWVVHGLIIVGGQESAMVLLRERGGGRIDGHETVSLEIGGLEDLA